MRKQAQERILAIVDYLLRSCDTKTQQGFVSPDHSLPRVDQLYESLVKLGFNSEEINAALELISKDPEKIRILPPEQRGGSRPVWVFGKKEQLKLSSRLRGELLRLYQESCLTCEELFEIINCGMQMKPGEVNVADLPYLISKVIKESVKVESILADKDKKILS